MWSRRLLFAGVLVAVGLGVWVGVATAGTGATPWLKLSIGVAMMLMGGMMFLSRDAAVERRYTQLFGAGYLFLGASQLMPSGRGSIALSLVAIACMIAALVRRRRRLARAAGR